MEKTTFAQFFLRGGHFYAVVEKEFDSVLDRDVRYGHRYEPDCPGSAAPQLGKLSDNVGAKKVILFSLIAAGIIYIPQAFVHNAWQLTGLKFLLGLTLGGLATSVNAPVKKITPSALTGRIFGLTMSVIRERTIQQRYSSVVWMLQYG